MLHRSTLAAALAATILAGPTLAWAEVKVGYVDLQRALLEVDEGRAAKDKLKAMLDKKQGELDREQEALRKEKETLDKQAPMMSEETRLQKQTDLQKKLFDLAQKWEKGKADMATLERNELQSIFQKMDPIIADIAEREGLTMVFEKTDSGIVFARPSLDLTNELVRRYNAANPRKGKASASKSSDTPKKSDSPKK